MFVTYSEYGFLECPFVSIPRRCRKNTSLSSCNLSLSTSSSSLLL